MFSLKKTKGKLFKIHKKKDNKTSINYQSDKKSLFFAFSQKISAKIGKNIHGINSIQHQIQQKKNDSLRSSA